MLSICNESLFNDYFANRTVICSGLAIGTPDKFIEYNNSLVKIAKGKHYGDQRYFNYIIYYEKLFSDSIVIKNNSNTHLMNIASAKRRKITLDKNYNILNYNGEIASVVHQYNWHKDILTKIDRKFDDANFNYTVYKEQQLKKYLLSKYEKIKFGLIISILFIINVVSVVCFIKKLKNYFLKQNNELKKTEILYLKKGTEKI